MRRDGNRPAALHMKALNRLPNGWQIAELGDLVSSISAGTSVNAEDRPKRGGELGVLKTSCVFTGVFRPEEHKAVLPKEAHRAKAPVCADTIIVSRMNTPDLVGANAFVPESMPDVFLPDRLWQLEAAPDVNARWLAHVLGSYSFRAKIRMAATGTSNSMKNISQESLLALPVHVPPLAEQRRVVEILRTWDEAIDRVGQLLTAKDKVKRSTMEQLLRPCCDDGFTDWPEVYLGELFDERVERGASNETLLSVTSSRGIIDRHELEKRDTSSEDKSNYKLVIPGDIGYNTMRMWQGVSGLSSLRGIVSPAYTVCTPRADCIDGEFAAFLFKLPRMIFQFWRYSQGLVDDTLSLKFPNFARIKVRLPDIARQRDMVAVLKAQDAEISILNQLVEQYRHQKRGLLQKLLTGEWRVPDGKLVAQQFASKVVGAAP